MNAASRKLFSLANGSKVCVGGDQAGGAGGRGEAALEVDLRAGDRRGAQRPAQERDVVALVLGDLLGVLGDGLALEGHLATAGHAAAGALAVGEVAGQTPAVVGVEVELGLEVLEVEREVEDRAVARSPRGGGGRGGGGQGARAGQRGGADDAQPGEPGGAQEVAAVGLVLGTAVDHVDDDIFSEHAAPLTEGGAPWRRGRRRSRCAEHTRRAGVRAGTSWTSSARTAGHVSGHGGVVLPAGFPRNLAL